MNAWAAACRPRVAAALPAPCRVAFRDARRTASDPARAGRARVAGEPAGRAAGPCVGVARAGRDGVAAEDHDAWGVRRAEAGREAVAVRAAGEGAAVRVRGE